MKKIKLQLNASQWRALMLIIQGINFEEYDITFIAMKEQLQRLFLRLANRLPTVTNPYYKRKYFALSITASEAWALLTSYPDCPGDYERIVMDGVRAEIYKQIA